MRGTHDVRVREVACVGAPHTLLLAEIGGARSATLSISAGVHGDEPVPPWALFSIVSSGLLDSRYAYRLWPCTNPTGYQAGTRFNAEGQDINRSFSRGGLTPEAKAIITATRDRKFALSMDLHEDFEAEGCYCYDAGCPVQDMTHSFDLGYPSDTGYKLSLKRGRVITNPREEVKHFEGLPYSIYIARRAARRSLTFESPRKRSWNERIAMHRLAVTSVLAALVKVSSTTIEK